MEALLDMFDHHVSPRKGDSKMLSADFDLTAESISFFKKHGFLKLESFFTRSAIEHVTELCRPAVAAPTGSYGSGFSKFKYDIGNDDPYILRMMKDGRFASAMIALTGHQVFFTQGLGFELKKNKSTGFPWHVGTQSFGFQRLEDFGCTIWIPLCAIDSKGQGGGMAYVPKDAMSGTFIYQHINLLPRYMESRIEAGAQYGFLEFNRLKNNLLNSNEMYELLNFNSIEDDFEIGDALIFDKFVLHRSVRLEEGPLESRLAYALRFSSVNAKYDQHRVAALYYPRRLFNYDVGSDFNDVVCSRDGERVYDSAYFGRTREERKVYLPTENAWRAVSTLAD